jgi:DNA-binding LytR/AlgR family response regulator
MKKIIIVDQDDATRTLIENTVLKNGQFSLVRSCRNSEEAAEALLNNKIDIAFIDMMLPGMDTIGFIDQLNYERPQIVVITSNKNAAKDAFDFDAADFILKPVTHDRLLRTISKIEENVDQVKVPGEMKENVMFLKVNSCLVKVNVKDIFMVEALADYVHIHTNAKRYTIHSTMKGMEQKLSQKEFVRVHKSYIVRIDRISEIEKDSLAIEKHIIPIGNTHRKNLFQRLHVI